MTLGHQSLQPLAADLCEECHAGADHALREDQPWMGISSHHFSERFRRVPRGRPTATRTIRKASRRRRRWLGAFAPEIESPTERGPDSGTAIFFSFDFFSVGVHVWPFQRWLEI